MGTTKKRYIALARVSSREQEREGYSLDVQVEALQKFAERNGGEIVRLWRIAETASKRDARTTFKEIIAYAKKNARQLDGFLVYKVDRAARNMHDFLELERLESEYNVPFISTSQHTPDDPGGRMQRRILASMATFFTEQLALDVRDGMARRVKEGWFACTPPFGYRAVRKDGRSVVEVHSEQAKKVARIFQLYASHQHTIDSLVAKLEEEGVTYTDSQPKFCRSKVHHILRSRAYIGEIPYKGQSLPGKHSPLVDRDTWSRVQTLLGEGLYRDHEMVYASELIKCGHCGCVVTGERKFKKARGGIREYVYYRCSSYNKGDHPRDRVTERDLDNQMLALFARLRVGDEKVQAWFVEVIHARARDEQREDQARVSELNRQLSVVRGQQKELLNLRLLNEIDSGTFATANTDLRDREAELKLKLEACDRGRHENADVAVRAFELSQSLRERWVTADYAAKRSLVEILLLKITLNDKVLAVQLKKPFDLLLEGPRGDSGPPATTAPENQSGRYRI